MVRAVKAFKTAIIILVAFSLLPLFYLISLQNTIHYPENKKLTLEIKTKKESIGTPMHLTIPAINVNAGIQYVGVTTNGSMGVPSNTVDVGWFKLGPHPGQIGSAVIDGHLNGKNGENGVFANLYKLKKGDKLYIKDSNGATISFTVRKTHIYNPGYADEVFSKNDSVHLNLITCDGMWDEKSKSYSKRLVVFADITH